MRIGCVKEIKNNEFRVGLTPDNVKAYVAAGHEVLIEVSSARSGTKGNIGLYITANTLKTDALCREHIEAIDGIYFAMFE